MEIRLIFEIAGLLMIGFVLGYLCANRHNIYGYFMSKKLQNMDLKKPPPSIIHRPFARTPKRKPRVNNDRAAWLKENNREL